MIDNIIVKELTKGEMEDYKELKKIKVRHWFFYFIVLMIIPFLITVIYIDYLTFKALFFISIFSIAVCSLCSYIAVYITSPHGFFFEGKYRLVCKKCRGRIFEVDSNVYKCYCGCKWSQEEVTKVIKAYKLSRD